MYFYVVTPSFNQVDFLKRCVASVADQAGGGIKIRHHVQDACSTDGTVDFLEEFHAQVSRKLEGYSFSFSSEADAGMYDAINRGWRKAPGDADIVAHLNCDEQYLPRAFEVVAEYFSNHWKKDVVLADMIVVDGSGNYICHRRSLRPNKVFSRICCVGMTTTTFQRASVVRDKGVLFDPGWRNIGDMVWYNDLHRAGVRFGVLNRLVAVFADTGENLNLTKEALRERKRYANEYLFGLRLITRLVSKFYSFRRWLKEFVLVSPGEYALYWDDLNQREIRGIENPTALWHRNGPEKG